MSALSDSKPLLSTEMSQVSLEEKDFTLAQYRSLLEKITQSLKHANAISCVRDAIHASGSADKITTSRLALLKHQRIAVGRWVEKNMASEEGSQDEKIALAEAQLRDLSSRDFMIDVKGEVAIELKKLMRGVDEAIR